jgi:hypothetical protein
MTDFNHSNDIANAVAVQADGKPVVVGTTYINNDFSGENFASTRLQLASRLPCLFRQPDRNFQLFKNFAAQFPENNQCCNRRSVASHLLFGRR